MHLGFYEDMEHYPGETVRQEIEKRTPVEVERALRTSSSLRLEDLISLLSPSAESYLEDMAQRANQLTEQRFGRLISLYAPLYLSNQCINSCLYCGFNVHNSVPRLTLTVEQAAAEGEYLHNLGFRHVLLVSGEAPGVVTLEYLASVLEKLRPLFPSISVEIYPMSTEDYQELIHHGVDGLVIYQETYDEKRYREVHAAGKKKDYHWRLATPERGGHAGFRRIGIGALLGLNDWRIEGFFLALHARYLLRTFWKSHVTISFPRLRPAAGASQAFSPVSDIHLVQLLTALRLFLPDVGLIISTREAPRLRDHLIPLGITTMSAGSRTEPGGYTLATAAAEAQFEVADLRSPQVIADMIRQKGYEPVWKDWDAAFLK